MRYDVTKQVGRLHVITGSLPGDHVGRPSFVSDWLSRVEACLRGGADLVQFRQKEGSTSACLDLGRRLRKLCHEYGTTMIVNDRVDLCLAIGADGVHLGDNDMPVQEARSILGSRFLIGATVRDINQAFAAQEASANYVGLGPIFQSPSKNVGAGPFGLEHVAQVSSDIEIPVVAIGGIDRSTARAVVESGAWGVAVIGAIWNAESPQSATADLLRQISAGDVDN